MLKSRETPTSPKTKNPIIADEVFKAVVWGGIEPPTQGFSVLCSTN